MRKNLLLKIFLLPVLLPALAQAAGVSFQGAKLPVQSVNPDKNTGLNKIYVAYDMDGLSMVYHASSNSPVTVYRYSSLGGGYAEEVQGVTKSGLNYTIPNPQGELGYIIEEGDSRFYLWLVDYSKHRLTLSGITPASEQECDMTVLNLSGSGDPIHYYTINGRQCTLDQEIKLSYYTLEYSDDDRLFHQVEAEKNLESFSEHVYLTPAPLCDTRFHISGDRFLHAWNWTQQAESDNFSTPAVAVHTYADQTPESTDPDYKSNQMSSTSDSGLGGSAPAEIVFTAIPSDACIHYEWQFATDEDFENLTYRFNERDLTHIFNEEGTTYVRFVGSNADGTCEAYGDTFTVNIGSSDLKCPNAFSPGTSEGVNDEWKVSYRSIIDFQCWIFNRHGRQLAHWTNPSQGWDGKVGGKVVKSGVYYYVIEATGADGRKYKLSGDINVIGYKGVNGSGGSTEPDTPAE